MKVVVLVLVLGLCCFHQTSGGTHSLKYFYTASSEVSNFPEFVVAAMMDEIQFVHYDSNSKRAVPKQDWIDKAEGPLYWERNTVSFLGAQQAYKVNLEIAKERFNQTNGVHTLQSMHGCEWDDVSEETKGFSQYGYDGEDFVSLDLNGIQYAIIATKPQSFSTKKKWEDDLALVEYEKNYYHHVCIGWLKKYVQYGSSTLERKVPPEVSLLQKDSRVVCHATGFYPEAVMITWKRDGVEMQEDVDVGETLTNADGTFQKKAVLTVSPEELKNRQYTCEVAHKSGQTIIMDETEIQRSNPDSVPLGPIIGVVVALIVLIAIVAGVVMLRRKQKPGFNRANTDESQSQSSNEKA